MLTDEIFWKMDLNCVYHNGVVENIENGYYVYLIVNDNKYYVGMSENLSLRIYQHKRNNTNNINNENTSVYILEKLNTKRHMRIIENIWIIWFVLNTECVNVERPTRWVRSGFFNKKHTHNTNYKLFCDYEYITGIKLLNKIKMSSNHIQLPPDDELTFFGRTL